ncbi:MAG: hypothetical protein AABY64_12695 [Bdellovibrionota bacterium]
MLKNKFICLGLWLFILTQVGCGVKGKPMPPMEIPSMSKGERLPQLQKLKREEKEKKKIIRAKDKEIVQ